MAEKLSKLKNSILEAKIRLEMSKISSGELSYIEALKAFEKIEQYVDNLEPDEIRTYQPYCDGVKRRVLNHIQESQNETGKTL